jgi:hypothetical protein
MGRFSPTVAPVANDGLANALGNFTESYMQFAARRRQKDMDAIETGVGLTPVDPNNPNPTSPPSGPLAALRARLTGRTNPNDIATAVRNAAPAVQGANAVNAGIAENLSRSSDGSPPTGPGGFVANRPTSGGNYATNEAVPGGSFPDLPQQMRLPSGQIVPLMMTPMGQRMMAARLAALGMGSEIGLRNSEIAKNQREAATPRLGDPGYAAAIGQVEQAKALAVLPVEIQKQVAAGQISLRVALATEAARGNTQAALQLNQQQFTAGENTKNRSAEAERQTTAKGEELSNKLTEIQETQKGQVLPTLIRGVKGAFTAGKVDVPGVTRPLGSKESAPATAAPSGDVKTQRADWDAAAAHARQQGKDPDDLLGPRP